MLVNLVLDDEIRQYVLDISLRALNSALRNNERIELSMLPVFDGVTLAYKRANG